MKLVLAQIRMELTTLVRNYEQLLLIMVIPIGVLVFFGNVAVLPDSITLTAAATTVGRICIFRMIAPRSTVIIYCTTERVFGQPR